MVEVTISKKAEVEDIAVAKATVVEKAMMVD